MVDRLHAALDARRDPDFCIIARTDARAIEGLDSAIDRSCRYAETGVDLGFVEAPRSLEELARIAREVPLPQLANMLPGGVTPLVPLKELDRIGFKVAVDPTSTLALCGFAVRAFARAWLEEGMPVTEAGRMTFEEIKDVVGVKDVQGWSGEPAWRSPAEAEARRLHETPFVVVSHGTEDDPLLNYGNRAALDLWEMPWETFVGTPSRLTAEPVHRDERARLLERTAREGYVDDYAGVRISRSGKRFRIEEAIVWNVVDTEGRKRGQAATFDHWTPLPPDRIG